MKTFVKRKGEVGLVFLLIFALVLSLTVSFGISEVDAASYNQVGNYTDASNINTASETLINANSTYPSSEKTTKVTTVDGKEVYAKYSKTIAGTNVDNQFDVTLNVETNELLNKASTGGPSNVMLVLDVSGSMDGNSTFPVVKKAMGNFIREFLAKNPQNRMAVSIFAGEKGSPGLAHANVCEWSGDYATVYHSFSSYSAEQMRQRYLPGNIQTNGQTNGQAAFRAALEGIKSMKQNGQPMSRKMPEQYTASLIVTDSYFNCSYTGSNNINADAINESIKYTTYAKSVASRFKAELYAFGINVTSPPISDITNSANIKKTFFAKNNNAVSEMVTAFSKEIQTESRSYMNGLSVSDPMSKWIKACYIKTAGSHGATVSGKTLNWNLASDATARTTSYVNGGLTTKIKKHTLTYTVTLDTSVIGTANQWDKYLPTNKDTVLTFSYHRGSGSAVTGKTMFRIPTVKAYKPAPTVGDIKISKTVTGNAPYGDTFDFNVYVGSSTTGAKYTGTYSVNGVQKGYMYNGQLQLKGGEVATLTGLPLNSYVTVKETTKPYYTVSGGDTKTGLVSTYTNTIAFTNNYSKSNNLTGVKTSNPPNGSTVQKGDNIRYSIIVTNNDSVKATGVVVRDEIPKHTSIVNTENGGIYDSSAKKVDWYLGDIAPGASSVVSFTVKVSDDTDEDIVNVGLFKQTGETTKDAALANQGPYNKTGEVIHKVSKPSMEIVKTNSPSAIKKVRIGDTIDYKIKVNNTSNRTLQNVWIMDFIPEGAIYKAGSVSTDYDGYYQQTSHFVEWVIPEIKVGESAEVSFSVIVGGQYPASRTITNKAFGEILGIGGFPGMVEPSVESNETINPINTIQN